MTRRRLFFLWDLLADTAEVLARHLRRVEAWARTCRECGGSMSGPPCVRWDIDDLPGPPCVRWDIDDLPGPPCVRWDIDDLPGPPCVRWDIDDLPGPEVTP